METLQQEVIKMQVRTSLGSFAPLDSARLVWSRLDSEQLAAHWALIGTVRVCAQGEHSRELEKLKRENRELRQQLLARKQLLGRDALLAGKRRQMKARSLACACAPLRRSLEDAVH